mmetsp:Transcript_17048/g.49623  ORF Transcript_17048/g.49623 Transcript_17048/m.49623 type:complete len:111 (+) Transcript_17048:103-435(+)
MRPFIEDSAVGNFPGALETMSLSTMLPPESGHQCALDRGAFSGGRQRGNGGDRLGGDTEGVAPRTKGGPSKLCFGTISTPDSGDVLVKVLWHHLRHFRAFDDPHLPTLAF